MQNFHSPVDDRVGSPGLTLPLLVSQAKARLLLALDHDNFKELLRKGKLLPIPGLAKRPMFRLVDLHTLIERHACATVSSGNVDPAPRRFTKTSASKDFPAFTVPSKPMSRKRRSSAPSNARPRPSAASGD
jgi:hypothetical protein